LRTILAALDLLRCPGLNPGVPPGLNPWASEEQLPAGAGINVIGSVFFNLRPRRRGLAFLKHGGSAPWNTPRRSGRGIHAVGLLLLLAAVALAPARAASPEDLVPAGSGLYDAVALLGAEHLLPPGAPDAADLQGVTARLRTRRELADLLRPVTDVPADPRAAAALAFCRRLLAPELGTLPETVTPTGTPVLTGFAEAVAGGRDDNGTALRRHGELLGRGRLLGTLGRDGAYTVSVTNLYRQTRDHFSISTRGGGQSGGDNPDVLNGVDEAYVTAVSSHGLRVTLGELRQRWGSGYRGDLLLSDNAPARPTLQLELPFSLGRTLGDYRLTQLLSRYRNAGQTIYGGARRLEHPLGDRTTLSVEEDYTSTEFGKAPLQILPYYAYQKLYLGNNREPLVFNYNLNFGLTVTPRGPGSAGRVYGQFYIDDLQAPKGLGKGNKTPRKIGYLLGYADALARSGTDLVLEFTHTDRELYTRLPPGSLALASFRDDLPLGDPVGPNGNEVFLRLGQRLGPRLDLSVEARDRRRASADFPAVRASALDLALAYHLGASQSVGLAYSQYREDPYPGTVLPPGSGTGGADYGEILRRHVLTVSFLQGF